MEDESSRWSGYFKGESQVQTFVDKGKPFRKSFKVSHTLEGLGLLVEFLDHVQKETGQKPPIILEATGHYQTPVVQYLDERGYLLIIIRKSPCDSPEKSCFA